MAAGTRTPAGDSDSGVAGSGGATDGAPAAKVKLPATGWLSAEMTR
ncbi:hypothetical protein ACIBMZ_02620 [Micromonospora sp. NPDC049900]